MQEPFLKPLPQVRQTIAQFRGLDLRADPGPGSFSAMENLSSRHFPALASRSPRTVAAVLSQPKGLAFHGALAWVDGGRLYWKGEVVPGVFLPSDVEKQMVFMGVYLLVFPEGAYVNTTDLSDHGFINQVTTVPTVRLTLSDPEGTPYEPITLGPLPPEHPKDGEAWMDTTLHSLKTYRSGLWTSVASVCIRLEAPDLGKGFSVGDGVTVSGCTVDSLNGTGILSAVSKDVLVLPGSMEQNISQTTPLTVSRKAPQMDFIVECGNRLWGCRYGMDQGTPINEIYASALGDFKNWQKFQGLSTDSYAAQRGSYGPFTGACVYQGCPLFWKEDCLEKVYPAQNGGHQIVSTLCPGVQKGSHRSLSQVGSLLYYKSGRDVCVYDGSMPEPVSQALGPMRYQNAVGGTLGSRYFLSMENAKGEASLLVYDTRRKLWYREDGSRMVAFTAQADCLYGLRADGMLFSMDGGAGQPEGEISWSCETEALDFSSLDGKYLCRLGVRLNLPPESRMEIQAEYDSDGVFHRLCEISGSPRPRSIQVPLAHRRCHHLRLRFSGAGPFLLFRLVLTLAPGGDGP